MRCCGVTLVFCYTYFKCFFNIFDLQKAVVPLLVWHLWEEMILKALEVSDDCKASAASCNPLSAMLEHVAVFTCVPLTQEGATNFGKFPFVT